MHRKKTVGLALSSGGIRGVAHVGVIKQLVKHHVPINYLAGSSIGALIGALYAMNADIDWLEQFVLNHSNWHTGIQLLDPSFKGGVLRGKKIAKFLQKYFGNMTFKDLKIPLVIISTDLNTSQEIHIKSGRVVDAIMASIAAPPIFAPVYYKNRIVTDGGISNPLPDDVVRKMGADIVISSDLENGYFNKKITNPDKSQIGDISLRALSIMRYHLAKHSTKSSDIIINSKLDNESIVGLDQFFDKRKVAQKIKAGESATKGQLQRILSMIG